MEHTSSKLLTEKPCAFITGRTCAASALRSLRVSSSSSGVDLRGVMKLICGFGFASTSFSLRCTILTQLLLGYAEEYTARK